MTDGVSKPASAARNLLGRPRSECDLAVLGAGGFLAVWAAAAGVLAIRGGALALPLISFCVFAVALPALSLGLSRPPLQPEPQPARPWIGLGYLALFAVLVLGWGFSAVRAFLPAAFEEAVHLAVKLLAMVAVPLLLMARPERRALTFRGVLSRPRAILLAMILGGSALIVGAVATGAPGAIAARPPSGFTVLWAVPAAFLWVALGAGLTEEVLFRGLIQPRLKVILRSSALAVFASALVFALAHVPGLYLRGDQQELAGPGGESVLGATAYALAVLAPPGVFFGVLWARTRAIGLLILIHALIDLPHNFVELVAGRY